LHPFPAGRLLSAKFNLVPVPELAEAPLCTNLIVLYSIVLENGTRRRKNIRERKQEMEIRFTSVPEKTKQKQKNVYNIIKVIPDSFYCLHYASILLVTVPAHFTPFPPRRQTMSYLPFSLCCQTICILNRIAGRFTFILYCAAVGCCCFISILY